MTDEARLKATEPGSVTESGTETVTVTVTSSETVTGTRPRTRNRILATGSARACARGGFTLFELLITMALMAILLGIGLGAMNRPLPEPQVASARIREAVRRARNFALAERSLAFVVFDPGAARPPEPGAAKVSPGGVRTVGLWHFEDDSLGGLPAQALAHQAEVQPDGAIGRGLYLRGEQPSFVDLGSFPGFDAVEGVRLELFVRPDDDGARTLFRKGEAYGLRELQGGRLEATVLLRTTDDVTKDPGRRLVLETDDQVLRPGRLSQVVVTYDGWHFEIRVDGLVRASFVQGARTRMLPRPLDSLIGGDPERPFGGLVDEVRVGIYVIEEADPLPRTIVGAFPRTVVTFGPDGQLDRRVHDCPVEIAYEWGNPPNRRVLRLTLSGEVP
ncbi:MAG: LamG-like jellyroll fold domain-containing protein [Planctomycetota bacterium]